MIQCSAGKPDVTSTARVSRCGGFRAESARYEKSDYCKAEKLHWTYQDGTLELSNERVLLNCCGSHSASIIEAASGSYILLENDAPDNGVRCKCMCVYDFQASTENIPATLIDLKIKRRVKDKDIQEKLVLETQLNLNDSSGTITIDPKSVDPWCQ